MTPQQTTTIQNSIDAARAVIPRSNTSLASALSELDECERALRQNSVAMVIDHALKAAEHCRRGRCPDGTRIANEILTTARGL